MDADDISMLCSFAIICDLMASYSTRCRSLHFFQLGTLSLRYERSVSNPLTYVNGLALAFAG